MDPVESLFLAMYRSDVVEVQRALGHDPSLARAQNGDKLPALHFARFLGHTEIVQMLIAAGPPLDVFESAALGLTERVEEALAAKPELLSALSPDGFTVLHLASYYRRPGHGALAAGARRRSERRHAELLGEHADPCRRFRSPWRDLRDAARSRGRCERETARRLHAASHACAPGRARDRRDVPAARGRLTLTNDEGKTPADVAASQGNIGWLLCYERPRRAPSANVHTDDLARVWCYLARR